MPAPRTVWGIDVGQRALKALKLRNLDGELRVEALDIIEHPKILSQEDADRRQIIQASMEQFLARNDVADATVAVAVPGQTSFTKFVKLPPVEEKKVPDIVRFEAEQQIPFPIDDVIWRWQTFQDPDSPDVEVGLFAMKRENVDEAIAQLSEVGLSVDIVQMAPLALYNFMVCDEQLADDGATLLLDVGTDKTDLVVSDGARIWTRTIQIGGNNFTQALVRAFKLSFAKAEKLKRTAATSKYARQIFQAMRPVFADLVQEIQRSIGYYTSLHRETRFARVLGLGNGFRLPGLQKFLQQNLNVPVTRLDNYNRLQPSPEVNTPAFTENVQSLGVAYGLAVQALGLSPVATNLLPGELAHRRLWAKKRPWFAAAAAALVVALALPVWRAYQDRAVLADDDNTATVARAERIIKEHKDRGSTLRNLERGDVQDVERMDKLLNMFSERAYWPEVYRVVHNSVNAAFGDQEAMTDYIRYLRVPPAVRRTVESHRQVDRLRQTGDVRIAEQILDSLTADRREELVAAMLGPRPTPAQRTALPRMLMQAMRFTAQPRRQRQICIIERIEPAYYPDIAEARTQIRQLAGRARRNGGASGRDADDEEAEKPEGPGFAVVLTIRTPLRAERANDRIGVLHAQARAESQQTGLFAVTAHSDAPITDETRRRSDGRRSAAGAGLYGEVPYEIRMAEGGVPDGEGPAVPDPLFPDESMADDERFRIGWVLTIE